MALSLAQVAANKVAPRIPGPTAGMGNPPSNQFGSINNQRVPSLQQIALGRQPNLNKFQIRR